MYDVINAIHMYDITCDVIVCTHHHDDVMFKYKPVLKDVNRPGQAPTLSGSFPTVSGSSSRDQAEVYLDPDDIYSHVQLFIQRKSCLINGGLLIQHRLFFWTPCGNKSDLAVFLQQL